MLFCFSLLEKKTLSSPAFQCGRTRTAREFLLLERVEASTKGTWNELFPEWWFIRESLNLSSNFLPQNELFKSKTLNAWEIILQAWGCKIAFVSSLKSHAQCVRLESSESLSTKLSYQRDAKWLKSDFPLTYLPFAWKAIILVYSFILYWLRHLVEAGATSGRQPLTEEPVDSKSWARDGEIPDIIRCPQGCYLNGKNFHTPRWLPRLHANVQYR